MKMNFKDKIYGLNILVAHWLQIELQLDFFSTLSVFFFKLKIIE
jgi:hypothetical protein